MGPALNMLPLVNQGAAYEVSAWVRVDNPTSAVSFTTKVLCREATDSTTPSTFTPIQSFAVSNTWVQITTAFTAPVCEAPNQLQDFKMIIEGPAPGVEIYVDDVRLTPVGGAPGDAGVQG